MGPGDGAMAHRRRRLTPGALDRLITDVFQPRKVINAGAADNAKHSLCHRFFPSLAADWAPVPKAPEMFDYIAAR